jgi:hypothetical protein
MGGLGVSLAENISISLTLQQWLGCRMEIADGGCASWTKS